MWQKITENLKFYLLVVVSFVTFCAGLFHLAYWQVFGIDGIAIVSISEFIKSFIYPVCSSLLFTVFILLWVSAIPKVVPVKKTLENGSFTSLLLNMLLTLFNGCSYSYFLWVGDPRQWLVGPFVYGGFFIIAVNNSKVLLKTIQDQALRQYVLMAIVYLPLISFGMGKYKAGNIFYKKEYDYTITDVSRNDTLKYLGNSGTHFIFTSMDNSKNYFINTSKADTLVLLHSGKDLRPF